MAKNTPRMSEQTYRSRRRGYRPSLQSVEPRLLLSAYLVTTTSDSGAGSLADAITQVNEGSYDTIDFRIAGAGPFTIGLGLPLPPLSHRVIIDGTSQLGYAGSPVIQIQPAPKSSSQDGLTLAAGS